MTTNRNRAGPDQNHTMPWTEEQYVVVGGTRLVYECDDDGRLARVMLPGGRAVALSRLEVMAHELRVSLRVPAKVRSAEDGAA